MLIEEKKKRKKEKKLLIKKNRGRKKMATELISEMIRADNYNQETANLRAICPEAFPATMGEGEDVLDRDVMHKQLIDENENEIVKRARTFGTSVKGTLEVCVEEKNRWQVFQSIQSQFLELIGHHKDLQMPSKCKQPLFCYVLHISFEFHQHE